MTEDSQLRAGDLLDGKYRIEARVGHGGMGAVYRGTHLHTTRTVAIKIIRSHLTSRAEFVERFSAKRKPQVGCVIRTSLT